MEKEWHRNHTNMYMVTFSQVPPNVVNEMAKHLDTYGDASWEYLADWLGLPQLDIKVIMLPGTCVLDVLMFYS